ncbi:MAG: hypothetical protein P8Q50_13875 [Octadecabacter sp.]|nr:hypothetical protein [Octadecabacter sp.]
MLAKSLKMTGLGGPGRRAVPFAVGRGWSRLVAVARVLVLFVGSAWGRSFVCLGVGMCRFKPRVGL